MQGKYLALYSLVQAIRADVKSGEHWGELEVGVRVQDLITNRLLDHVAHFVVAIIPDSFEARDCLTRSVLPPCLRAEK